MANTNSVAIASVIVDPVLAIHANWKRCLAEFLAALDALDIPQQAFIAARARGAPAHELAELDADVAAAHEVENTAIDKLHAALREMSGTPATTLEGLRAGIDVLHYYAIELDSLDGADEMTERLHADAARLIAA